MKKNGYVYADIQKVMYGITQEGRIVNNFLTKTFIQTDTKNSVTNHAYERTSGYQSHYT